MHDRRLADVGGPGREVTLTFHDGTTRTVVCTEREMSFPPGELIVSQTDPYGRITMCNQAFEVMSGFAQAELVGQPHHLVRHPDMPRAAFADLWVTIRQGLRWSGYVNVVSHCLLVSPAMAPLDDAVVATLEQLTDDPASRRSLAGLGAEQGWERVTSDDVHFMIDIMDALES